MMRIVDPILVELDREAAITKRVLERVPNDKLTGKPHAKSMSLGQLALHVATTRGQVAALVVSSEHELPKFDEFPAAASAAELVPALEQSVASAKEVLSSLDNQTAMSTWKLTKDGKELLVIPRIGVVRSIMLNYWYHHRGQLSVYLRLLNIPVPSIYGPSADENPFF
ncbi:MAG: DinB family protein [candidate division NC10 bacterium]|nr:DinB family protein [candidate division NC10 bacterium]